MASTTNDYLELNSSLQSTADNAYMVAIKRCTTVVASALGLDYLLTKTPVGAKVWPNYKTFKIDNKFYTLTIITLMCAQYSVKSTQTDGLSEHNHTLFQDSLKEEMQQIEELKAKKEQHHKATVQQPISTPTSNINTKAKDLGV